MGGSGRATADILPTHESQVPLDSFNLLCERGSLGAGARELKHGVFALVLRFGATFEPFADLVVDRVRNHVDTRRFTASATAVTVDFTKGSFRPQISEPNEVILMRALVVVFIVISMILAQLKVGLIVTMMSVSWGAIAGAFLGPYFWTLFGRRSTPFGAWVGLLGGLAGCHGLNFAYGWDAKYATLWSVLAMLASLVLVPLASLVTKPLPAEHFERRYGASMVELAAAVVVEPESA